VKNEQFKIEWFDRGRPPRHAPNPDFPNGIDIDSGERPACRVELPYMTKKNVGYWYVECTKCKTNVLITMASRPDDPKSVMLPCAKLEVT
jgi:hypothetical protein